MFEMVSYEGALLAKLKARMNIQGLQVGKITDRCRDCSTQLIRGKTSEQNDKKKREIVSYGQ